LGLVRPRGRETRERKKERKKERKSLSSSRNTALLPHVEEYGSAAPPH
jgi:hypothetical protein